MILDLHIHSKYSFDSILEPKKIIQISKKKGLNGIAITDHNTIEGGVKAKKINRDSDFLVIVGAEIGTEVGDITGLFLTDEIRSKKAMEVIEEIKGQGGLSVLPHPFRGHTIIGDELLKRIDLIEGFNARSSNDQNLRAQNLAKKYEKPSIAGSDAHFGSEIGLGKTCIEGCTSATLREDLLHNKIKIEGVQSPSYLQQLSQLLKSLKTRHYQKVPVYLTKSIYYYLK